MRRKIQYALVVLATNGCIDATAARQPSAGSEQPPTAPTRAAEPDNDCVVARGRDFQITLADIEPARLGSTPPLTTDQAIRVTVDAWLAEWDHTGAIGRLSAGERLDLHRARVSKSGSAWSARRRAAIDALGLRYGACYVATR